MDYKIIDAHTHIFPEKIADKAVGSIGDFYGIGMQERGLSSILLENGAQQNIAAYLVCSTATVPAQVCAINDFIYTECQKHPEFIGFGTLHPLMENPKEELKRIAGYGFRGIKFHPDFQKFNIDDPKAMAIYQRMEQQGLALLIHTGDNRYDYSKPRRMAAVAKTFPAMTCIAPHFGGYQCWKEARAVYDTAKTPNLFFDTSSALFALPKEEALQMIEQFGYEHFFFGTDFPMWDYPAELERFFGLGLSPAVNQAILSQNFERRFQIQ